MTPEDRKHPGTVLFLSGVILVSAAGAGALGLYAYGQTGHYTMTEIPEGEVEEYADSERHRQLQYERLSDRSQSIIEKAAETDGTYTTIPASEEFLYVTDANQQNVVEYRNTHYLLRADRSGNPALGFVFLISLVFAGIGGALSVGGFLWSPLRRRVVRRLRRR